MIKRATLPLGIALVICAAWLAQATPGAPGTTTVIDRTLRCTTSLSGGIREVEARANAGTRLAGKWVRLPFAAASTGNVTYALTDSLGWITAGKPSAGTMLDLGFRSSSVQDWGTLGVSRACRAANVTIPLAPSGLKGGGVSQLGARKECRAPRRVLLRVRAVATAKTDLRTKRDFLVTSAPLKSAQLAVRTENGKPVLYTDVNANGRARLFTAKGCVAD